MAEDNDINALLTRALLIKLGHHPTVAANGAAASTAGLRPGAGHAPFDRILMDLHMPGMDGFGGHAPHSRHRSGALESPRTPILALTANASAEDREACLAAGMDGFLVKPLDRERLAAALSSAGKAALAA